MDASGRNAIVTLLANLLSERLDEEQLAAAASVITQLGTTLGCTGRHAKLKCRPTAGTVFRSCRGWNTISPAQYRNEAIRPYATLFHACGTNAAFSYGLVFWLSSNFR